MLALLRPRVLTLSEANRSSSSEQEYINMTVDKFIFKVRKGYLYSEEGVWVKIENDVARVGIADFVQKTIGDMTYVSLPREGEKVERSQELVSVESIKASISIPSPITGSIREVNRQLDEEPELINQDPYGSGWLVVVMLSDFETDRKQLLEAEQYFEVMKGKVAEAEKGSKEVVQ